MRANTAQGSWGETASPLPTSKDVQGSAVSSLSGVPGGETPGKCGFGAFLGLKNQVISTTHSSLAVFSFQSCAKNFYFTIVGGQQPPPASPEWRLCFFFAKTKIAMSCCVTELWGQLFVPAGLNKQEITEYPALLHTYVDGRLFNVK